MAKKPAKTKSRAVVGSSRKKRTPLLTAKTFLFGLVGILAFSSVVGLGWQQWQDHRLEAQAAGYTRLMTSLIANDIYINACKKLIKTNNYNVKLKFVAYGDSYGDFAYKVSRSGVESLTGKMTPYGITYATLNTLKGTDKVMGQVQTNNGAWFKVSALKNC